MQIHELPAASPSGSDYIAIDDGDATRKATLSAIDVAPNQVTFTSGDSSSPSNWQTVAVLASNTLSTLMGAISKMVANVRWLYNRLGTSSMGTTATTVTGAVGELNTKVNNNTDSINALNSKYEFVTYNGNLGALSAGASGYITASVTIPTGYRTTGIASIAKQHIAGAAGLTIMANMPRNNTGTVTFYPSYYTPTSVASGNADFQIRILYERDA